MQQTDIIKIDGKASYSKYELQQIVNIHINTFQGFFLTFLGKGFLYHLYQGYDKYYQSGIIVARQGDRIIGFVAYSGDYSNFYKYLIKTRSIPFAGYSFLALFRKPSVIIRLIRAFLKPGETKRTEKYIELASIGVLPEFKGKGIGTKLIDELKKYFNEDIYEYINLETDAENNKGANSFYVSNGFMLTREYTTNDGRKMNEYRWKP